MYRSWQPSIYNRRRVAWSLDCIRPSTASHEGNPLFRYELQMTRPNEDAHKELFEAGMGVRRKVMVCPYFLLEISRALTSAQGDAFIDNMIKQVCVSKSLSLCVCLTEICH